MDNSTNWFRMDIPVEWPQILIRSALVAVVAFIVMQAKEWFDAGQFDTLGTGADALLIAAGVLVVNAILMMFNPNRKPRRDALRETPGEASR